MDGYVLGVIWLKCILQLITTDWCVPLLPSALFRVVPVCFLPLRYVSDAFLCKKPALYVTTTDRTSGK